MSPVRLTTRERRDGFWTKRGIRALDPAKAVYSGSSPRGLGGMETDPYVKTIDNFYGIRS
jgi:hypothetical protein